MVKHTQQFAGCCMPVAILFDHFVGLVLKGLIKNTGRHLLPKVYINSNDFLREPSYSGKVSVRKITSTFGLSNGVTQKISEHVGKKWKLVWLILSSRKYLWFIIDRIYWRRNQRAIEVSDDPKVFQTIRQMHTYGKRKEDSSQ